MRSAPEMSISFSGTGHTGGQGIRSLTRWWQKWSGSVAMVTLGKTAAMGQREPRTLGSMEGDPPSRRRISTQAADKEEKVGYSSMSSGCTVSCQSWAWIKECLTFRNLICKEKLKTYIYSQNNSVERGQCILEHVGIAGTAMRVRVRLRVIIGT